MVDRLGVAVLGYGFMGKTHLSAWKLIGECEVKAVMGRTLPKVREVAKRFGAEAYNRLDDVLRLSLIHI